MQRYDSIKQYEEKKEPLRIYQGNGFTINQPDGWQDKTIYTLMGPIEDGIQHNILIAVEYDADMPSLAEYAESQIMAMEKELKGCIMLKKEEISLANGLPAYRAVFRWYPVDEMRIYQEQVFVLAGNNAYKLTASFNKKTRKTLGPQVERIMLSFKPEAKND